MSDTPSGPSSPFDHVAAALADRYHVQRELGRGGMATVYLAEDRRHGRRVALKVMHPELTASLGVERFGREVRIAAGLTHPHILALFDSGEAGGLLYYAMPYIEGESLRQRLEREHELPVAEAMAIARAVADALGHAHALGFVHRDVKPENILISGAHALLADFGVARAVGDTTAPGITQSGLVVGSPLYMSPEQSAAESTVDGRSDLYSLGCVLFEMLVGVPPFTGNTPMRLMARHMLDPIPSARVMRAEVPPALDAVIARALAKHADDRFPSALAFLTALDAVRRSEVQRLDAQADARAQRDTRDGADLRTPANASLAVLSELDIRGEAPPSSRWAAPVRRGDSSAPVTSVAVLPFADLSAARDQEFLCDGITEDLRAALSRLSHLRVAARTSALAYKGRAVDVRTVGRELDVASVLEGTVQRGGDRVRISASLLSTADGFQLWTETFDRDASDLFAVQNEIATRVVDALSVHLSRPSTPIVPRTTTNVEAYQLYLRGRHLWGRRQGDALQQALACYRQALEIDPLYVMPLVGLADAFNTFGAYEYLAPTDAFPKVIAAAERALTIDSTLAEAHTALGCARAHFAWEWRAAEDSFRQALAFNPQYSLAHAYYALMLAAQGRHERARDAVARAQQLDPLSPIYGTLVGWVAYFARDFEASIHLLSVAVELEPSFRVAQSLLGYSLLAANRPEEALQRFEQLVDYPSALGGLGYTYGVLGRADDARAVLARMDQLATRSYMSGYNRAQVYIGLGDHDTALDWLDKGADERTYTQSYLAVSALVDPLRGHPRFRSILDRMHLTQVPGAFT